MKFATACLAIASSAAIHSSARPTNDDYEFNDDTYFALSASDKQDQLWSAIMEDTTIPGWYNSVKMGGVLTESQEPTIDTPGDQMPP